jgi:uncharacterized protein (DUF2141 family)
MWILLMALLAADGGTGATVRIEASQLRSMKGELRCALYSTETSFPEGEPVVAQRVVLGAGVAPACEFTSVPAGTWAATAHHDENVDARINKGLFGIPSEGYGVSNNHTYATHGPRWHESTFAVTTGAAKVISISLRN